MFRFNKWGVSALTIAVILASLVCGAFGMSFQMAEPMDHVVVVTCDDGMCASDDTGCLEHCLSRADASEERIVVAPVVLIVRGLALPASLYQSYKVAMAHESAPPWQSHRLFAFRE